MNFPLLWTWYASGDLASRLTPSVSAALIMLVASVLVFRTFREKHLLVWILGWLAFAISGWIQTTGFAEPATLLAASHSAFVLAIACFAAAILVYSQEQKYILPLFIATGTVMTFAVARILYWPDEMAARVPFELAYRAIAIAAVVQLLRYRWGRVELGPWLLALSMLFLHVDWPGVTTELPEIVFLLATLVQGTSMLFIVFDDAQRRTRQLDAVDALTTAIGKTQQHGPMMQAALEQLKNLMKAKGAWFGLQEGDRTTISNHVGVSQEFLKGAALIHLDEAVQKALAKNKPTAVKASELMPSVQAYLEDERLHHLLLIPVQGKKGPIGTLALGKAGACTYTPEDLEFLQTSGSQLGIAVENLRLLEQVLRSQRQWMNTFDSIQDAILAHDAEFVITKANEALLQHLEQAPADVVGNACEDILPRQFSKWTGCPYCARRCRFR